MGRKKESIEDRTLRHYEIQSQTLLDLKDDMSILKQDMALLKQKITLLKIPSTTEEILKNQQDHSIRITRLETKMLLYVGFASSLGMLLGAFLLRFII